jgi:hypothetical protein
MASVILFIDLGVTALHDAASGSFDCVFTFRGVFFLAPLAPPPLEFPWGAAGTELLKAVVDMNE